MYLCKAGPLVIRSSGEASVVRVVMQTSAEGVRHPRGVRGHAPPGIFLKYRLPETPFAAIRLFHKQV